MGRGSRGASTRAFGTRAERPYFIWPSMGVVKIT
jgi:hypothetical protein